MDWTMIWPTWHHLIWYILGALVWGTLSFVKRLWHDHGQRRLQRRTEARLRADNMVAEKHRLHARPEEMSEELEIYRQALERRANGATSSERTRGTPPAQRRS